MMTSQLGRALLLSYRLHEGQLDKGGNPYILHPIYISTKFTSVNLKCIALLHDVVEDCDYTVDMLRRSNFDEEIVEAVDAISKRKGEVYADYIDRLSLNRMALTVKIEDMKHNSDTSRVRNPKEIERLTNKYYKWLPILERRLNNYLKYDEL